MEVAKASVAFMSRCYGRLVKSGALSTFHQM